MMLPPDRTGNGGGSGADDLTGTSLPTLPAESDMPPAPHPHLPGRLCRCRQLATVGGGRRG